MVSLWSVAALVGGGILVWSGIQNRSPLEVVRETLSGQQPAAGPQTVTPVLSANPTTTEPSGGGGGTMAQRDAFLAEARKHIGKRYVFATAGPNTFDCSGLVMYCYKKVTGKTLFDGLHSATVQWKRSAPVNGPRPGDLVFFNGTSTLKHHVAIVAGPGQMVSASNEQRGVEEVPIWNESHVYGALPWSD